MNKKLSQLFNSFKENSCHINSTLITFHNLLQENSILTDIKNVYDIMTDCDNKKFKISNNKILVQYDLIEHEICCDPCDCYISGITISKSELNDFKSGIIYIY